MKKLNKLDFLSMGLMVAGMAINFVGNFVSEKREDEKRYEAAQKAVAEYMAKKES